MRTLSYVWPVVALRGMSALLVISVVFIQTGLTQQSQLLLLGGYLIADGTAVAVALSVRRRCWLARSVFWECLWGLVAGVVLMLRLDVAALVALCLITAWVFFTGGLNVWPGFHAKYARSNPYFATLSGIASVSCGALLVIQPEAGVRVTLWIVATSALASAILHLLLARRLRRLARHSRGNPLRVLPQAAAGLLVSATPLLPAPLLASTLGHIE